MFPALILDDLRISVDRRPVVHGLDLVVASGERVALVGRSGSGKSLTAAAVAGHLPVNATATGDVRIGGTSVREVAAGRRMPGARAAMVFQDSATALHPLVTVGRQLAGPRGSSRTAAAADVAAVLTAVGIDRPAEILASLPGQLSGGQRQRVCLAMAVRAPAAILVADEPTTALDVVTQAAVLTLLRSHTGPDGPALLFITHDIAVAAAVCERIVVLDDGRIVDDGPTGRVLAAPAHPAAVDLATAARDADDRLARHLVGAGARRENTER